MAEDKKDDKKPEGAEKDTGVAKQLEALTQLVMSLQQQVEALASAPAAGAGGDHGHNPDEDAEIEALLAQLHGGDGGEGGQAAPAPAPEPEAPKKMSRDEGHAELQELKAKLRRMEITDDLRKAGFTNPDDTLVSDLSILPPDVYARQVDRLKLSRPVAPQRSLAEAVAEGNAFAQPAPEGKKKIATPEDNEKIVKLARDKKLAYAQAAEELGYVVAAK